MALIAISNRKCRSTNRMNLNHSRVGEMRMMNLLSISREATNKIIIVVVAVVVVVSAAETRTNTSNGGKTICIVLRLRKHLSISRRDLMKSSPLLLSL